MRTFIEFVKSQDESFLGMFGKKKTPPTPNTGGKQPTPTATGVSYTKPPPDLPEPEKVGFQAATPRFGFGPR